MSDQGELPKVIEEKIGNEFGQKPESSRQKWNNLFNRLIDSLQGNLDSSRKGQGWVTRNPKANGNIALRSLEQTARAAEGSVRLIIGEPELSILIKLAELGVKATGGRKSVIETPQKA